MRKCLLGRRDKLSSTHNVFVFAHVESWSENGVEQGYDICPMTCLMLHFHAPLEPTTLRTREAIQSGLATLRCPHRV